MSAVDHVLGNYEFEVPLKVSEVSLYFSSSGDRVSKRVRDEERSGHARDRSRSRDRGRDRLEETGGNVDIYVFILSFQIPRVYKHL